MVSKGAFVIGPALLLSVAAVGSAAPRSPINCDLDRGRPVIDVAVQPVGTVSAVRVFYRYEDGRDAYVDMVPVNGRYTARLPKSTLGAGGLSYRVVAESSFTTRTGMAVTSSQLVGEAVGCGATLREPERVVPSPVVAPAPTTPEEVTPPRPPAPPAAPPPPPDSIGPVGGAPETPQIGTPRVPPGPPTGGDPRSPPR